MKRTATTTIIAVAFLVVAGCSTRQELTRDQRVENLRKQARTADKERSEAQLQGLREGQREMAREQALQNSQSSSSPN